MEIENEHGLSELLGGATVTQASGGYTFTEGPVWVAAAGCLVFSDIPTSIAHRWQPGDATGGLAPVYRQPTGSGNGMVLDDRGRLICCEQGSRRVVRFPFDDPTDVEVIADRYDGSRLNSPNDVVIDAAGRIFFTDPTYGLGPGGEGKELPHNGVYRIDPDGAIDLIDDRFLQPNGLVLSPDERFLYIGDSQQMVIRRFTLLADGSLIGGAVFADMRKATRSGYPDGMTIDTDGRLWATGPGGIWVIDADGTPLGQIPMPAQPANLTFGGEDFSTLFITAETGLYQLPTRVQGAVAGNRPAAAGPVVR